MVATLKWDFKLASCYYEWSSLRIPHFLPAEQHLFRNSVQTYRVDIFAGKKYFFCHLPASTGLNRQMWQKMTIMKMTHWLTLRAS